MRRHNIYLSITHNEMKLKSQLHKLALRFSQALAALVSVVALAGCDGFIYEDQGDCDPKFRVRLKYDKNMKFADAFANEVNTVTLYVIDEQGNVVHRHTESGDRLKADGYEIVLDGKVPTGRNYRMLAWCGDGSLPESNSFSIPETDVMEQLTCRLLGDHQIARAGGETTPGGFHVARELQPLYHHLTEPVEFPDEEGYHYYTLPLMKDTNTIKVVLQHLSDHPIDPDCFEFDVTAENGHMNYDNSLLPHETVTYHAWSVTGGSAVMTDEHNYPGTYSAIIGEITVGRLMEEPENLPADKKMRLNVWRKATDTEPRQRVLSIPLVDVALLVKGQATSKRLTDQQYLDYQDDYNFIFFLDEGYRWTDATVYINSWHHVIQNVDL